MLIINILSNIYDSKCIIILRHLSVLSWRFTCIWCFNCNISGIQTFTHELNFSLLYIRFLSFAILFHFTSHTNACMAQYSKADSTSQRCSLCVCVFVRTLNDYMISRVVKTFSSYLSKPFQKVKDDFIRVLFGDNPSFL